MSYSKRHGVSVIAAGDLVRGNLIEVIEGSDPPRYFWREITRVEMHKEHSNRIKITFSGGRVAVYAKNQTIRYKRGE